MAKYLGKFRIESNRLKDFDYKQSYWYFVTICTKNMKIYFGQIENGKMVLNNYGSIIKEEISNTQLLKKADIDEFVVMPNHVHLIVIPETAALGTIIGQIKSISLKKIKMAGLTDFQWQPNYYEHIIRSEADLYRVRNYIKLNPLKWEIDEYYSL